MKKFIIVMASVFVMSVLAVLFIVYRGDSMGREMAKKFVVREDRPSFPISKEKLPESLVWKNGEEQKMFASDKAKKGGTSHQFLSTFPTTFRQRGPNSNSSFRSYLDNNDMALVEQQPNTGEYIPSLATAWAVGPDNKTVYFKLDRDAKWSDGTPVLADDYVFSLKMLRSASLLAPFTKEYTLKYVQQILKFDDYTIAVRLPDEMADLVNNCNWSPQPYHYYGKFRQVEAEQPITFAYNIFLHDEKEIPAEMQKKYDDYKMAVKAKPSEPVEEPTVKIMQDDVRKDFINYYQWKTPPKNGPYMLYSWVKGKEVVFKKVKDWWATDKKLYKYRYNVQYIHMKLIRDVNIAYEHFRKGDLDAYPLNNAHYWHVKAKYLKQVEKGYMNKLVFYNEIPRPSRLISFNMDKPPLDDINVRLGLSHSFNFEKLFTTLMRNDVTRLDAFADGYGKYTCKDYPPRKYDLKKAAEYFDKAGWTERDSEGFRTKDGKRLEFKILYPRASDTPKMIIFKESAKKAGVSLKLDNYDPNAVFVAMLDKKHQLAWHGWSTSLRPRYWGTYHGDNAHKKKNNNFSNLDDKELNELINIYRKGKNELERIALVKKIEKRLYDLAPATVSYKAPFMRYGYWRWFQVPDSYATKTSEHIYDYGLFWVDEDLKKETKEAMRKGKVIYGTKKLIIDKTYKTGGDQ